MFSNAEISDTEFLRVDFIDANFSGTVFNNVKFISGTYTDTTFFSGCTFNNVLFDFVFHGNFKDAVFSNISFGEIPWEHCKINIGTSEKPHYLCGEEIRQWILNGGAKQNSL